MLNKYWLMTLLLCTGILLLTGCLIAFDPPARCFIESETLGIYPEISTQLSFSWSPDGQYIAYTDTENQLFILPIAKANQEIQPLATAVSNRTLAWSSDSQQLLFASWEEGKTAIFTLDIISSNVKRITNLDQESYLAVWIPNTNIILVEQEGTGKFKKELIQLDTSTGERETVLADKSRIFLHSLTPDGSTILFTRLNEDFEAADSYRQLYLLTMGQKEAVRVSDIEGCEIDPMWSPNSSNIAFSSSHDKNWDIYVIPNSGTAQAKNLTQTANIDEYSPAWSPDGMKITFMGFRPLSDKSQNSDKLQDIFMMDNDGRNIVNLTTTAERHETKPLWSPDGSKIAFMSENEGTWTIDIIDIESGNRRTIATIP